jgi:signal peptidase II
LIGLLILSIDASSKWAVQTYLPDVGYGGGVYPYGGVGVFRDVAGIEFSVIHTTNTGTIWGLFPRAPGTLVLVRLVVITLLVIALSRSLVSQRGWLPLILILAGAVGNVADYFFYGHVVDLFFFRFWGWGYPVFNVADASIFLGIVALFLRSLSKPRPKNVKTAAE